MAKKKVIKPVNIRLILDGSGSMSGLSDDVIGSVNAFIDEQKKAPGEANLEIVIFNDRILPTKYGVKNIKDYPEFTNHDYVPSGMTALQDAIGITLSKLNPDEPCIVAILTDGQENSSKEYSLETVNKSVSEFKGKGNQVIFLSSEINASSVGASMGFAAASTVHTKASPKGYGDSVKTVSDGATLFRSAYTAGVTMDSFEVDYKKTYDDLSKTK